MVVVGNHNLIAGAPMAADRRINTFTMRFIGIIRMIYAIKWYNKTRSSAIDIYKAVN
jgi:hypothetical protein